MISQNHSEGSETFPTEVKSAINVINVIDNNNDQNQSLDN